MCLILLGWRQHPDYPLVVAANRDEFHARPTAPAARWADAPQVLAGRDLQAGGTWLGISDAGRFAALTNVRAPGQAEGLQSRGALVADFLRGNQAPMAYATQLLHADYTGFNLFLCDGQQLVYTSNRIAQPQVLPPGIYGLSNHLLDSPWPKLLTARQAFAEALAALPDTAPLFELLTDTTLVPDAALPNTGVSLEWERRLSAIFVRSATYGTRASSVVTVRKDGQLCLEERSFDAEARPTQSRQLLADQAQSAQISTGQ